MSSGRVAQMAKKVTLDGLGDAIKDILEEYGGEVRENLGQITKSVTQAGVQALRSESAATFGTTKRRKQKYAKTWTSRFDPGRVRFQGTIYNTQAGLPHLLENGHVTRNGTGRTFGKVPGREHIAKVERELEKLFEAEVMAKL